MKYLIALVMLTMLTALAPAYAQDNTVPGQNTTPGQGTDFNNQTNVTTPGTTGTTNFDSKWLWLIPIVLIPIALLMWWGGRSDTTRDTYREETFSEPAVGVKGGRRKVREEVHHEDEDY